MNNIHGVYERDLDLNLLRVFAVVADEGSITRAASRLYITQPAVSAAMRRLSEFVVGAELIARQGRGVVLTTRGAELAVAARAYLGPLVAATLAVPVFDPKTSTATVRLGLADPLEALLLPHLLANLRAAAPSIQLIVLPVQFRTVEDALLSGKVDLAVTIADELPRSILRQPLVARDGASDLVCLYDRRFTKLPKKPTERDYFAHEHVAVSYAGDARGIVEDSLGKTRKVRVSVAAFGHVANIVDGSPLLATLHLLLAQHIIRTRPHLRYAPVPFELEPVSLDLLWLRTTDADEVSRFMRELIVRAVAEIGGPKRKATGKRRR